MSGAQRYVSGELTHFVGRGLPEARQYETLVRVLRDGLLAPEGADIEGHLVVDEGAALSANEAYAPEAVCLCDIPVGDLDIHIAKYSPFGLAFAKPFVVERGANPMFYVAGDSRTWTPEDNGLRRETRAQAFDRMVREHHALRRDAERLAAEEGDASAFARRYLAFAHFLDFEVFSYTKFFSYPAPDEAPDNYYMEREWRLLGPLRFELAEVRRVILPESYARRFREDVPTFAGQVTFGSLGGDAVRGGRAPPTKPANTRTSERLTTS